MNSSLDAALFSADVFTDVANGIILYRGPAGGSDPIATLNDTEGVLDDGRIRQAQPRFGILVLTIPFLPMMVSLPWFAFALLALNEKRTWKTKLGTTLFSLLLSVPFTTLATPLYVLFVSAVGIFRVVAPQKLHGGMKWKVGLLKTAQILLESATQTCLGENNQLLP